MMSLLFHFPPSYPLFSRVYFSNTPKNHAFLRTFLIFLKKSPLFSYFFRYLQKYTLQNHILFLKKSRVSSYFCFHFGKKSCVSSYFFVLSIKNHVFFRTFTLCHTFARLCPQKIMRFFVLFHSFGKKITCFFVHPCHFEKITCFFV